MIHHLRKADPELASLIEKELRRQQRGLVMIPSENFASLSVLETTGSVLTNKYAEGYPGKRYYTGNKYINVIEQLAIDRAKKLFSAEHANVQPHSGSGANMACYASVLNPGDTVLGLDLAHGGHLTHGSSVNFSGKTYNFIGYKVRKDTELLDMDEIRKIAKREKPKLILSGTTAYSRIINFDAFSDIASEVGAYAMADISHIVGLILAKIHPNPVPTHDIVMTTTTKTLRGPRSAIILSRQEDRYQKKYHSHTTKNLAERIDFTIFPGMQGGPLEHTIAAKAAAFKEAMKPSFVGYQKQIVKNAHILAETLGAEGLRIVSGGTDTHLMIIDCSNLNVKGKEGAKILSRVGIYTNKNMIPYDTQTPFDPSGIRLGTPALTSRGMKEKEMIQIAKLIAKVLQNPTSETIQRNGSKSVQNLTEAFPLYPDLHYA